MKRIIYTVVFAVLVSGLLFTCGDPESKESCDANDLADQYCSQLDIDLIATFCSDGENNSYYTYDGDKYPCDGVESSTCTAARTAMIAKMKENEPTCITKKSSKENYTAAKTKLSKTAEKLLRNVRLNSMNKGL